MEQSQNHNPAIYLVGLPIGNKLDISARAIQTLQNCDLIAAEDTRVFLQFCKEIQIQVKQVLAYHDHNERESAEHWIKKCLQGKSIAVVSDAGTPNINDPGFHLLKLAYENKIPVIPIPGPSSVSTALSVCPIGGRAFCFAGFAPSSQKDRIAFLQDYLSPKYRLVVFESPHRILEHLQDSYNLIGDSFIFIAREMTKTYEEYQLFKISDAIKHFTNKPPKGEFVLIYDQAANPNSAKDLSLEELANLALERLNNNLSTSDIIKELQSLTTLKHKELYKLVLDLKKQNEAEDNSD